jgi:proteasome lid subunit RPN8/RPN11
MAALESVRIPVAADAAMRAEAERAYPHECCGIATWVPREPHSVVVLPYDNQQNRLHELDPAGHPRDARTAYNFDALKLQRALEASAADGRALALIFHSHPEHGAYFSETDRAAASPLGSPTYPEAAQLVYSVVSGRPGAAAAFRWNPGGSDFHEVELQLIEATA